MPANCEGTASLEMYRAYEPLERIREHLVATNGRCLFSPIASTGASGAAHGTSDLTNIYG